VWPVRIKPYTLRLANEYVRKHHRHSKTVVGCKFCIAAVDDDDEAATALGSLVDLESIIAVNDNNADVDVEVFVASA